MGGNGNHTKLNHLTQRLGRRDPSPRRTHFSPSLAKGKMTEVTTYLLNVQQDDRRRHSYDWNRRTGANSAFLFGEIGRAPTQGVSRIMVQTPRFPLQSTLSAIITALRNS